MLSGSDVNLKISVLLPAYNCEKYVEEAIKSILGQTYSNFELLIADDASTDRTKEVIHRITESGDCRIHLFHNAVNLGKTGTVANLFKRAVGDLVTIHDADDCSLPERFERQVEEFQKYPDLGLCGTSYISVTEDGNEILETVRMKTCYKEILVGLENSPQFHGPTMMMKKSILDELEGVYRPYFENDNEDTDLAYRIAERHQSYNLSEILYKYRILSTSLRRQSVTVRNRNLYKVVSFLANERRERGSDSIQEGKAEVANEYFSMVTEKYSIDSSLIHREAAELLMHWRLHWRAIKESSIAVRNNPFQLVNYRTLQYCIRKLMFTMLIKHRRHGGT